MSSLVFSQITKSISSLKITYKEIIQLAQVF